jgi:TetR/AcrR family transcriptional regulator, mexJK operon transcriptional repressor
MTDGLRPSSLRKRTAILEAAEQVFLRDGYLGANMDELTALSGVSKQTVYAHFGSKEALFVELVESMTRGAGDAVHTDDLPDPTSPADLRATLTDYAVRQLTAVLAPRILRLRRLVIGEESRFPELARVLWENGPARAMDALAGHVARLSELGWLVTVDPRSAASYLNWLVMGEPVNRAMLLGDEDLPDTAAVRDHCAEAVRIFLAGYGARRQGG